MACGGGVVQLCQCGGDLGVLDRLTINIQVQSVFRHEFQSTVSNFPSWCITVFWSRCLCLCFDGIVSRIRCLVMPDY